MNNPIRIFSTLLVLICCFMITSGQNKTETFYLKDGTTIRGAILSQNDTTYVVATDYGTLTIQKSDVVKKEASEISSMQSSGRQRQIIQMKDGNEIRGVITEEKNDSLTVETSYGSIRIPRSMVKRISNLITPIREHEIQSPSARYEVIEDSHQDWEILAGLSIPTGDFGSTSMQGGKPGYATMGFSIGWGYHGELAKGFEGGFIQMFSYNSIDETEYMKLFPSGTSVDAGGWYHLWTMGGLGFAVPLETSGRFHAGGLLGFLMGFSPSITATYGSFTASQSTSAAQAISYGAYVGFRVTRVAIDLHYLAGEPEYSITAASGSYTVSGKVKQPTALFQITLCLIFN